ncbi:hypothetical protein RMCBS344292_03633 [Rhizopus microsporus]|nr:hypothetical protein RMCBS344292_03633 [Rhizopus microsporus]
MDTAVVEKPKTSTAPKATKVSDTFKRIFIQAKALKEASALVSAASITAIGNQAQRSVILLNDVNESEEEEVDIEGDDYEWNAEEVKVENEEEDSEDYRATSTTTTTVSKAFQLEKLIQYCSKTA